LNIIIQGGCQRLHQELTKQIIGAFYAVNNRLGFGFFEKVYENSLKLNPNNNNAKDML
jgi:hypothetical protein